MLAMNGLPRFFHPAFRSDRFRRVTADRFFLFISAEDAEFDLAKTRKFLTGIGGSRLTALEAE
jgi:hypothetical protein